MLLARGSLHFTSTNDDDDDDEMPFWSTKIRCHDDMWISKKPAVIARTRGAGSSQTNKCWRDSVEPPKTDNRHHHWKHPLSRSTTFDSFRGKARDVAQRGAGCLCLILFSYGGTDASIDSFEVWYGATRTPIFTTDDAVDCLSRSLDTRVWITIFAAMTPAN